MELETPLCTVVVDTREQNPLDFSRFGGWFAGIETRALKLGDYSIAGLEDRCVVERKDLPDLTYSLTAERPVFVHRLRLMSRYPHRLLVITTTLSRVKSLQPHGGGSPNRLTQSLIAVLAGLQIPFLCRRATNWEKRWSPRTSTRFISIIGWKLTTTADSWPITTSDTSNLFHDFLRSYRLPKTDRNFADHRRRT